MFTNCLHSNKKVIEMSHSLLFLMSLSKRNKGFSLTFQLPEEGRNVVVNMATKMRDNSLKNLNNVHNTSSPKYRPTLYFDIVERSLSFALFFISGCVIYFKSKKNF